MLACVVAWSTPTLPGQAPPALPAATLQIELVGVLADPAQPARSSCLIRCLFPEDLRRTTIVTAGQQACDVAEVREVRENGVVLWNPQANRLELLTFSKGDAATGTGPPVPGDAPSAAAPLDVRSTSPDMVTVDVPKDTVVRTLANLPELLDAAIAVPRYRDGAGGQRLIDGFEIGRIREGSVVEQVGLKNGDVILDVNGDKLDSLATVMRIIGQLQTLPQAKMTVLRDGRRMTFVFNAK